MTLACIHTKGSYAMAELEKPLRQITTSLKDHPESISKKIWGEHTITWQLGSDTPSIEGRKIEEEVFKLAFLQIGLYIPNRLQHRNKPTADADIKINFSKFDSYWGSHPSVLAYAYGPQSGIGGNITFNTKSYIWTPDGMPMPVTKAYDLGLIDGFDNPNNKLKTFNVQHTGNHEGEHAMGMPHIEREVCPGAIINPYYNGAVLMKQCEIDFLQRLYGKKQPNNIQLATLLNRIEDGIPY